MSAYSTGMAWNLMLQGRVHGPASKLVLLALADRADHHGGGGYHIEDLTYQTGLSGGAVRDALRYMSSPVVGFLRVSDTHERGTYRYRLTLDVQKADKLKSA